MMINRQCVFDFHTCTVILSMRLVFTSVLPLKDSCVVLGPEIPSYQIQGEAVVIKFPFLEDAIRFRKLPLDNTSMFYINHTNHRNQSSLQSSSDRVMISERGILLLPCHQSDSGIFTYIFRDYRFCFTGSISLTIYEAEELNVTVMPYTAHAGEYTRIICPHLNYFKKVDNPKWYKDFQSIPFPVDKGRFTVEMGIILTIKNISVKDEGFYTCKLKVVFNNTQYNVSRTWRVQVSAPVPESPESEMIPLITPRDNAFTSSGHLFPCIIFPVNGSFIESHFGSRLLINCTVITEGQLAEFTDITWLVDGISVENSHLGERAFQTDKIISANRTEVQLIIPEVQEQDNGLELKCVSQNQDRKQEIVVLIKLIDSTSVWLVVFTASSCFIVVVSIFLYHLCRRPEKHRDYSLAGQKHM